MLKVRFPKNLNMFSIAPLVLLINTRMIFLPIIQLLLMFQLP